MLVKFVINVKLTIILPTLILASCELYFDLTILPSFSIYSSHMLNPIKKT